MTSTDRESFLISECQAGRVDCFGELVTPYQDRLYNMLYRMLGQADDASEALQDSLVRAFRFIGSYEGGASFYTWLYRIAINTALTRQRRQKHRQSPLTESALEQAIGDDPADRPEHPLEVEEQQRVVQEALTKIAETYRVVLVLRDIEGLKYEQIAEILDVPVGTVRSRLHRGRGELKQLLLPLLEAGVL